MQVGPETALPEKSVLDIYTYECTHTICKVSSYVQKSPTCMEWTKSWQQMTDAA